MKHRKQEVNFYITFGGCLIMTMGFSLYFMIKQNSLWSLCSIGFFTIVSFCLYAFFLKKVIGLFEEHVINLLKQTQEKKSGDF